MEQCWAVRKKDENSLHVAEIRTLRWIRGKTRKDHVRKQIIQEDAKVCQMSTLLRQKRLNWYGHIRRRKEDNLSRKIMDMVVPGKRRRGRPRRRWIDNNREDMSKYKLTADMTENRQYWKMMVKSGPQRSGDGRRENVDHNNRTLDEHDTFHGMLTIAGVTPGTRLNRPIPRVHVASLEVAVVGIVQIRYHREERRGMPVMTYQKFI